MDQFLLKVLGYIYSLIALPSLALIGITYYRKIGTKGSGYFAFGAIATAIGSMFNQLFPIKLFLDETSQSLSPFGKSLTTLALTIHIIGFIIMVIGLGILTFAKRDEIV
jgi:hypothetical protein